MEKNGADYRWSANALAFKTVLGEDFLEGHLKRLLQVFTTPGPATRLR